MPRKRCAIQVSAAWLMVEATTHLKSVGIITVWRGIAVNDRLPRNGFVEGSINSLPAWRRMAMMAEQALRKLKSIERQA